jgi:hypothetical protein
MQPTSPLPAVATTLPSDTIWEFAEACVQRTAGILHETRSATPAELSQGVFVAREAHVEKKPVDLLEIICRIQGHDGERLNKEILELGHLVASYLSPYAPYVPFAGKLITPSAFYETYKELQDLAKILRSPVIYAEDTDSIGTASINPVASEMLAEQIREVVFKRVGIRPFITIARLDYESWIFLSRKHFDR